MVTATRSLTEEAVRVMRAAVAEQPSTDLEIIEVRLRDPDPDEIRVRLEAASLCRSDLKPLEGTGPAAGWPLISGHEGVGTVTAVGQAVTDLRAGERVIVTIVAPCLRCFWCVHGEQSLCTAGLDRSRPKGIDEQGRRVHGHAGIGAFAEQLVVSRNSVVPTASDLPAGQLAMLSCGFTTGFSAVATSSRARAGSIVAVFGLGGVGLAAVQAAHLVGASDVIVVDPVAFKRESAMRLGATAAVEHVEHAVEAIHEMTDGRGVDVAFEAIGRDDVANDAYHATRRGGQLVLIGGSRTSGPRWTLNDQMLSSKEVVGTFFGGAFPLRDIPRIIRLAEAGKVDLGSMVTEIGGLDAVNDAIAALRAGTAIKPVLSF
jgi:S-(hydroxymethyl)glutathione dehydrogenase/alcohol dehydrogenase